MSDKYSKYQIPEIDLNQAVTDVETLIEENMPLVSNSLIVLHEEDFEYYEKLEDEVIELESVVYELHDELDEEEPEQTEITKEVSPTDDYSHLLHIKNINKKFRKCNIWYRSPTGDGEFNGQHALQIRAKDMPTLTFYGDTYDEAAENVIEYIDRNKKSISGSKYPYELEYNEEDAKELSSYKKYI